MKRRTTRQARTSSSEAILDAAVELTFPASDPISIDDAFHAARERDQGHRPRSARRWISGKPDRHR
jgi:hypothetical protein